jgi:uncharacterized sulfatase
MTNTACRTEGTAFRFRKLLLLVLCGTGSLFIPVIACAGLSVPQLAPDANSELLEFHKRVYEPRRLKKIGKRVHMSLGDSYANFSFIEGDDGVIVIDAGFFTGNVEHALARLRETVTDKPIIGMIYTHAHRDHTGGSGAIVNAAETDIPIYAPADWVEDDAYVGSSLRDMVQYKAFSQFGLLLPEGINGSVGSGIGPVTRLEGGLAFTPPNHGVDQVTEITLAGVKMVMIPMYGDIKGHMWIWLPEEKVMFTGDTIMGTTMPYISTARFEPDRKALEFVKSLDQLAEYPVEYVVPGHGRALLGQADVQEIAILNRDFAQFMANQVTRFILKGYSADQIIDQLTLPPSLADHPDLQPYYHRLPWIIRGLYLKRAGWVDDFNRLARHTQSEEARRLLPLIGGEDRANEHALQSLEAGDYRWALQLASTVLLVNPENQISADIQKQAYQGIANTTRSANERNYMLTKIKELEGAAPWNRILVKLGLPARMQQSDAQLLKMMEDRFMYEDAPNLTLRVAVNVDDDDTWHSLRVRNGVLIYEGVDQAGEHDGRLTVSHSDLAKLATGAIPWSQSIQLGVVNVVDGIAAVQTLTSLIKVEFP